MEAHHMSAPLSILNKINALPAIAAHKETIGHRYMLNGMASVLRDVLRDIERELMADAGEIDKVLKSEIREPGL